MKFCGNTQAETRILAKSPSFRFQGKTVSSLAKQMDIPFIAKHYNTFNYENMHIRG